MLIRRHLLVLSALFLAACGDDGGTTLPVTEDVDGGGVEDTDADDTGTEESDADETEPDIEQDDTDTEERDAEPVEDADVNDEDTEADVEEDVDEEVLPPAPESIDISGARHLFGPPDLQFAIPLEGSAGSVIQVWARGVPDSPMTIGVYCGGSRVGSDSISRGWGYIPGTPNQLAEGITLPNAGPCELRFDLEQGEGELEVIVDCLNSVCGGPNKVSRDWDGDGILDPEDVCPALADPWQDDSDEDGWGDACEGSDPWPELSGAELRQAIEQEFRANHITLEYRPARIAMFGRVDNNGAGFYTVYTGEWIPLVTETDVDVIPDGDQQNTEHVWLQSLGARSEPVRSDLHHIYPSDSRVNGVHRNNRSFCIVTTPEWQEGGSAQGDDSAGNDCFEPRDEVKGQIARALFHVSVVHDRLIDDLNKLEPEYEALLREWHAAYPPTEEERARNDRASWEQNSRNVFIDFPHLVDRIDDF